MSLRTSDLDEARSVIARFFYSSFIDRLSPKATLDTHIAAGRFGKVTVGDVHFGADVRVKLDELGAYHVDLLLSGQMVWKQGRDQARVASPAAAAVFQPVGDTVLDRWAADCRVLAVKIDREALETQLARMVDAPVSAPIRFGHEFDVERGAGRGWAHLVGLLAHDTRDEFGLARHPLLGEHLQETLLRGLLLAADHQYRSRLERHDPPYPAPRAVRQAVDVIHAHPEWTFTIARLADIAGTSERSLQKGFQRHAGMSPMAYLRQVRLDRAHQELGVADPGQVTVAEVAYRWGFTHLGRFARAYRTRYGAAPSETLRARLPAPPAPRRP